MLLHADGFDWVPTPADDALLADRYTVGSEVTIDDSGNNIPWGNGVIGGSGAEADNRLSITITGANTMIVGFHVNPLTLSDRKLIDWVDGSLRITTTGKVALYNGAALVTESDAGVLTASESVWLEFKIKFSNDPAVGFIVVGINDSPVISTYEQTADSAITPNTWRLVLSDQTVFSDWLIKDTTGPYHDSFGGEAFVETGQVQTRSTALDGDTNQPFNHGASTLFYSWDNSVADNEFNNTYLDEFPADDDTTYVVEPGTADLGDVHRVDYPLLNSTLDTSYNVAAVVVMYRAKLTVGGSESFIPIRFDPSFDPGPDYIIDNTADSAEVYEDSPIAVTTTTYEYYAVIQPVDATLTSWDEDSYASTEYGYRSMA